MYLGLSDSIEWCKQADEALCFEFLDILFRSGNFGIKKQNDGVVEGVTRNIKKMDYSSHCSLQVKLIGRYIISIIG